MIRRNERREEKKEIRKSKECRTVRRPESYSCEHNRSKFIRVVF